MHLPNKVVIENIRASLAFGSDLDRQMPDPLANADVHWLANHPPKAPRLFQLIERQHIVNPSGVPWGARKADRSLRLMNLGNPYADLAARLALAPDAERIDRRQTDLAIAGRVKYRSLRPNAEPVLVTVPHPKAHGSFRKRREAIVRRDPPVGLKTDIRAFYPSVTPHQAELSVDRCASTQAAAAIRLVLEKQVIDTGTKGLPIGPETSAWFANMVLAPADHVLARFADVEALRWSDDLDLVDGARSLVEQCFAAWCREIDKSGLRIAIEKTQKSWDLGISGGELVASGTRSQGDITAAVKTDDWPWVAGELFDELRSQRPDRTRLNRLFGSLVKTPHVDLGTVRHIVDLMLDAPMTWESNVPRARSFLSAFADAPLREKMIAIAIDLTAEGLVASEQVVALCCASTSPRKPADGITTNRGEAAQRLLELARADSCVPVRGWARQAAYRLNTPKIRRQTIDVGEFSDLHAFEQRWAIAFADPNQHCSWLKMRLEQSRWPTTAAWRLDRA